MYTHSPTNLLEVAIMETSTPTYTRSRDNPLYAGTLWDPRQAVSRSSRAQPASATPAPPAQQVKIERGAVNVTPTPELTSQTFQEFRGKVWHHYNHMTGKLAAYETKHAEQSLRILQLERSLAHLSDTVQPLLDARNAQHRSQFPDLYGPPPNAPSHTPQYTPHPQYGY